MKVLICGMTASQSSYSLSRRNASFAGMLNDALVESSVEVVWADPAVSWTAKHFDEYDSVLVGVAPVLSMTANKAYGVLAAIETLYGSKKLRLFVDAPEPSKIHASLRSIEKDNSRLTKQLYSMRKEYKEIMKNAKAKDKVIRGASLLLSEKWPTTIYPALPIDQKVSDSSGIPESMGSSFSGVNLDSMLVKQNMSINTNRQKYWVIDSPKTKWCAGVLEHLMYPSTAARENRTWTDAHVQDNIASSLGVIIGPHDDKLLWWSSRFAQAMNTLTPVATEWRLASKIGEAWNHLASGLEQMSVLDRYEIAVAQRDQYMNSVPGTYESVQQLKKEIGI